MRLRVRTLLLAVAVGLVALAVMAGTASAAAQTDLLRNPAPSWFTSDFKDRVDASGTAGVPVQGPGVLDVCPGAVLHSGGVGTGSCEVYPYGCTANFIYYNGTGAPATVSDGQHYFIGIAGHCVNRNGESVYMATDTPGIGTTIQNVGTVYKFVDGGIGNDFSAIQVKAGLKVYPASPVGGPHGIYDGCSPQAVKYYGHGYGVAVAQGKPEGGLAKDWYADSYGWMGAGAPGDSGSGVILASNEGAGDFTHLVIFDPKLQFVPGELVGTRLTRILGFLGASFYLVNDDFSLARDDTTACTTG